MRTQCGISGIIISMQHFAASTKCSKRTQIRTCPPHDKPGQILCTNPEWLISAQFTITPAIPMILKYRFKRREKN
uniref:Phlebovirus glycoprotein G2 fusion domain-containing protein n=1 Tax=Parascaris equorum TaxID=6256 RepID=A0A914S3S5_PAREQ